jgi:hypothetical protein
MMIPVLGMRIAKRWLLPLMAGAVALTAVTCRDSPTEPRTIPITPPELVAFGPALQDVRDRVLSTFGAGPNPEALARAWRELEGAVSDTGRARLEEALARANVAAMQLGTDTTFNPDLDVVLLVLEQIQVTKRGPAAPRREP